MSQPAAASPEPTWHRMLPWAGLAARLVLGGVFLVAGALKVTDPAQAGAAVQAYRIFPPELGRTIGYALPMLEIVLGALLVLGLFTRFVAVLSAALYLAFIAGVASVWVRGYSIDCGCFGGGGDVDPDGMARRYTVEIVRDVGFVLLAAFVAGLQRTALTLDAWLFPAPPSQDEGPADDGSVGPLVSRSSVGEPD